jgi:hypothetical protein
MLTMLRHWEVAYKSGWMGLRSVPKTLADGYCSAIRC